jgi:predicted nucleotidyltransferase
MLVCGSVIGVGNVYCSILGVTICWCNVLFLMFISTKSCTKLLSNFLFYMQIGNWSRYLSDTFGMDADDSANEDLVSDSKTDVESDETLEPTRNKLKTFKLLNELSDLLMLPKDLLLEKSVRKEVSSRLFLYTYHRGP